MRQPDTRSQRGKQWNQSCVVHSTSRSPHTRHHSKPPHYCSLLVAAASPGYDRSRNDDGENRSHRKPSGPP